MGKALVTALFAAFLTAPVAAQSNDTYVANNQNGGQIVLSFGKCQADGRLFQGYSYSGAGRTLWFCWTTTDDKVIAVYEDGETYTYPAHIFKKKQKQTFNQSGKAL